MAVNNIRLGGLSSGFDTEAMVEQLLSSYQTKIDNQSKKLTKLSWQQEAYQDITTKITDFKNKYFDVLKRDNYLLSPSTFNKYKAAVSTTNNADAEGLSVTTTTGSSAGTYKLKLQQLATSTKAEGKSISIGNFALDLDKAIASASTSDTTAEDGTVTRSFSFALDVQVGSVKKTVEFSADAVLDADGNVADMDALKSGIVDSLNTQLQESFGYSGKVGGDAAGAVDAEGKEWFLQTEIGADGKVEFKVGGNATVTVTENKGNFGLSQGSEKVAVSTGSVVTGTNTFAVEIGGKVQQLSFEGVSTTYYDSRNLSGNDKILNEYNELKAAAYRKENNLSADATVTSTQLENYTYTSEQAAKDKNEAALMEALKGVEGYTFSMNGSYLTARDSSGKTASFSMSSVEGGTLGLNKASASNKATSNVTLSALGLEPNNALGGYSITINGEEISVDKDATVSGLLSAVNKSSAGVTMTYSALTNSFTIESNEMGGAGKVEIEDSDFARGLGLTDENGTVGVTQGQNAIFELNGQEVYLNDNSYTLDGTTFTFNDNMAIGETYTVNLTKDSSAVKDTIKSFVEDYNKLIDDVYEHIGKAPAEDSKGNRYEPLTDAEKEEMDEKEIEKWETSAKQGVLYNDSTVSRIMSQLRSVLYDTVTLDDGSKFGIFSMGIKTSNDYADHGKLEIDEDAFDKAFEKNSDAIVKLFTDTETGVMSKFNKVMDNAVKSTGTVNNRGILVQKAGKANSSVTTDSQIYKQMLKIQDKIKELQNRYDDKEEYWWKIFTNMESAMSDLNSQTDYISQYLGSGM
ncbi:MAG: flagellar filament capping protein FliD [Oscillospiraceae bacterium]